MGVWLIGNEVTDTVNEQREQDNLPFGVVQKSKKYQLIVRTWAEVLGDAEHRLKFVQGSLQYESNHDSGLASMRDKYSAYLPKEVIDEVAKVSDVGLTLTAGDGDSVTDREVDVA